MSIEPVDILAIFAVLGPVALVVQHRRKRVRVYCCSGAAPACYDLRMNPKTASAVSATDADSNPWADGMEDTDRAMASPGPDSY
ncbi:MAG: hypothetical protein GC156_14630 [Actinomycetales bacterium]|nr:hypothetical protein [Actinomycetales bacterium]